MSSLIPCIAFFFATSAESRFLKKHLQLHSRTLLFPHRFFLGKLFLRENSPLVLLVETGMGPLAARHAAQYAFSHFHIQTAWIFGLAGASQKGIEPGAAILATQMGFSGTAQEEWISSEPLLVGQAAAFFQKNFLTHQKGKILTLEKLLGEPNEKLKWGEKYKVLALEMEAFPIAEEAQKRKIPLMEIRWILDPAQYALPPLENWVDEQGKVKLLSLLAAFFQHPGLIFELPSFLMKVKKSLGAMNSFLQKWIKEGYMPSLY